MRVALDASDLASGMLDGTTIYACELLPRLAVVLAGRGHDVLLVSAATPQVAIPHHDRIRVHVLPGRRFWTQTVLSRALFRLQPDLLFLPVQTVPLYRPRRLKVVATIHDLDFLEYPEMFTQGNRFLLRWFTRIVARNATHVVAVSEATKAAIMRRYGRAAGRITVVHHGIDPAVFRPATDEGEKAAATARVRAAYGLPAQPILFVGALQPRKNVAGLVTAFEALRAAGHTEELVLVSSPGWKEGPILARLLGSPQQKAIHRVTGIGREDLPAVYWNAAVLVLPSFAEGFGLPVLEALACGTPVVISSTAALREVAGDTAEVADPHDPKSIADAINRVLRDHALREGRVVAGRARARAWTWERTTRETADVIEHALAR